MLRILSSKAQGCKYFEYSQMSTHLPGFRSFFSFVASLCILAELATSSISINWCQFCISMKYLHMNHVLYRCTYIFHCDVFTFLIQWFYKEWWELNSRCAVLCYQFVLRKTMTCVVYCFELKLPFQVVVLNNALLFTVICTEQDD